MCPVKSLRSGKDSYGNSLQSATAEKAFCYYSFSCHWEKDWRISRATDLFPLLYSFSHIANSTGWSKREFEFSFLQLSSVSKQINHIYLLSEKMNVQLVQKAKVLCDIMSMKAWELCHTITKCILTLLRIWCFTCIT